MLRFPNDILTSSVRYHINYHLDTICCVLTGLCFNINIIDHNFVMILLFRNCNTNYTKSYGEQSRDNQFNYLNNIQ